MAIFTEILLCFGSSEIVNYPIRSKSKNNKNVHEVHKSVHRETTMKITNKMHYID